MHSFVGGATLEVYLNANWRQWNFILRNIKEGNLPSYADFFQGPDGWSKVCVERWGALWTCRACLQTSSSSIWFENISEMCKVIWLRHNERQKTLRDFSLLLFATPYTNLALWRKSWYAEVATCDIPILFSEYIVWVQTLDNIQENMLCLASHTCFVTRTEWRSKLKTKHLVRWRGRRTCRVKQQRITHVETMLI